MAEKAILFDSSTCMACRGCQVACKQWWELPAESTTNRGTYENPPSLSAQTWNRIRFTEVGRSGAVRWVFTRHACMHCSTAICVWVCPTYARAYDELGFVTIDQERCIACGRCVEYCPFEVPEMGKNGVSPRLIVELGTPRSVAYKCKFCEDRVRDGIAPSCTKTCPTGALKFGDRTALVAQGTARVAAIKGAYPKARLYGEKELRGLHVMYVLTDDPAVHGLPDAPALGTYPNFDENTFPDWYIEAAYRGKLPVFPAEARREWYMQPNLVPAPAAPEPAWPASRTRTDLGWGNVALAGWMGVGVIGGATALGWAIRRRIALNGGNGKRE